MPKRILERIKRPTLKRELVKPIERKPFTIRNIDKKHIIEPGKKLLEDAKNIIKNGEIPIIILPDTSMRNSAYFFNTLLVNAFPEIYLPIYKKYRQQAVAHVYSSRKNHIIKIPDHLKQIKNAKFIIIDYSFTGHSMNRIKFKLKQQFGKEAITYNVHESSFNSPKKNEIYVNNVLYSGYGNVVKDDRGNIFILRKRNGKIVLEKPTNPKDKLTIKEYLKRMFAFKFTRMNSEYNKNALQDQAELRRELRQMALEISKEYK